MNILNLYAGLGGNRELWTGHNVTAVEINPEIAKRYADKFPTDKVIIGDAHKYLLNNYAAFDFIWSSPPCPTHSKPRFWGWSKARPVYPDMKLYEEIILLQTHYKGKFAVENVKPYYQPLIPAAKVGRHLIWSNFNVGNIEFKSNGQHVTQQLSGKNFNDKLKRNKTDPEIGLYILNCALDIITHQNNEQTHLFE